MATEIIKLSSEFETTLYTWDSSGPELSLDFDGSRYGSDYGSVDLTVDQAKNLIEQLQKFVDLSLTSESQ